MRNKLILVFSFILSMSYGQSKLDSLVFDKINQYRLSKHIEPIIWDSDIWKASNHHALYLEKLNKKEIAAKSSHYENIDLDDIKTFRTPDDRISFYTKFKRGSECVTAVWINNVKNNALNRLADEILDSWKKSPPHNKGILDKNLKYGSICVSYEVVKNIGVCYKSISVFNACCSDPHQIFIW